MMHLARLALRLALVAPGLLSPGEALPAFPGAEGQGAAALGGRGGDVYHVANLDDYNPQTEQKIPGSLRHAIRSADAPRTIVFDVAGPIALHAPLEIHKDRLTIAGQTAPAPGVTLWGYPVEVTGCSDVVIRYLRVRLGDFHARDANRMLPSGRAGNNDLLADSANAVYVGGGSQRVVLDHVSTSWSMDETLSVTLAKDVTIQNCIVAASLNDSFHSKGPHGYGSLIRGELTPADQNAGEGGYTLYGNLWMAHRARNPSVGGQQKLAHGQTEDQRRGTDVNIVNNVVYNWGGAATHRSELGPVRINLIGNYYICGPVKKSRRVFREDDPAVTKLFYDGNYLDADRDAEHDGTEIVGEEAVAEGYAGFTSEDELIGPQQGKPYRFIGTLADQRVSAPKAYERVVNSAGCSLHRDAIDAALIEQLQRREGQLIDSQEELRRPDGVLAGLDDLPTVHRPDDFDTDGDGMADEFERDHGLNPADPADGNGRELSRDGYTNLEFYLNWLLMPADKRVAFSAGQ